MSIFNAIASFVGGSLRNSAQSKQAANANAFSANQTAQQMAFQERMSNTAHQREAKDMKKAGINRILTGYGKGASSPSGAAATGQQANIQDAITPAVATGIQAQQAQANVKLTQAQTRNLDAQNPNIGKEGLKLDADTAAVRWNTKLTVAQRRKVVREILNLRTINNKDKAQTAFIGMQTIEAKSRIKLLTQSFRLTKLQADELQTKFPRLFQDQKINSSMWGRAMRWLNASSAVIHAGAGAVGGAAITTVGKSLLKNKAKSQSRQRGQR